MVDVDCAHVEAEEGLSREQRESYLRRMPWKDAEIRRFTRARGYEATSFKAHSLHSGRHKWIELRCTKDGAEHTRWIAIERLTGKWTWHMYRS